MVVGIKYHLQRYLAWKKDKWKLTNPPNLSITLYIIYYFAFFNKLLYYFIKSSIAIRRIIPFLVSRFPFLVPRSPFLVPRSPFPVPLSSFSVPRSPFLVLRSSFSVPPAPFLVFSSSFFVLSSPFSVACSKFTVPCSSFLDLRCPLSVLCWSNIPLLTIQQWSVQTANSKTS